MANKLHLVNTLDAIVTVDRIMAAVSMAHDTIEREHGTNQRLCDAWLVLQLAGDKLQDLRDELERADSAESATAEEVGRG